MVLEHRQLGVWLGMDYSQILLQHIIALPHYVLKIPPQKWEGELRPYVVPVYSDPYLYGNVLTCVMM